MSTSIRRFLAPVLVLALTLVAAPNATAADVSGYSGACTDARIAALPDTGDLLINYAGDAGCVAVRYTGGVLRLEQVVVVPGWSWTSKSSTSDTSRVQLQFTNATTKARVDFRIEPGRTIIR